MYHPALLVASFIDKQGKQAGLIYHLNLFIISTFKLTLLSTIQVLLSLFMTTDLESYLGWQIGHTCPAHRPREPHCVWASWGGDPSSKFILKFLQRINFLQDPPTASGCSYVNMF